jgi:uncharacterized protein YciI
MEFFVLGRDGEGVEELLSDLTEAHWAYMDGFAGRLRARGPLLSPDRDRHAGSMHVVDVPDVAAAYRFAYEEPFQQAGVFADLSVTRFVTCGDRTMYDDRPVPSAPSSTLVLARWDAEPMSSSRLEALGDRLAVTADEAAGDAWVFLGLLLGDDGSDGLGAAGALDLPEDQAVAAFQATLAATGRGSAAVLASPWQRGGRRA